MSANLPSLSQQIRRPVLYPTSSYSTVPLTSGEQTTVNETLRHISESISKASPQIGADFAQQIPFFVQACMIAKAKFQQAPNFPPSDNQMLSGELPDAAQIGINPIIPEDINRDQSGGSISGPSPVAPPHTWDLPTTAGTPLYIIGSSNATGTQGYFKTNGTEPTRYILAIMQNGLVEVGGNTPVFDQFFYSTNQKSYVPWAANPLVSINVEPTKTVYQYDTPGAIIMDETILSRLTAMPKYTGNSRVALVGIKIYEYNYLTSLAY